MKNKRYDCIRQYVSTPSTSLKLNYSLIEDLTSIGGNKTILECYEKDFGLGFDPEKTADEVEEFINKARANLNKLATEYGYTSILRIE